MHKETLAERGQAARKRLLAISFGHDLGRNVRKTSRLAFWAFDSSIGRDTLLPFSAD